MDSATGMDSASGTDRSEIGPYLGGCSSPERGSCYRLAKARGALGVGRFLRKRRSLHLPVLQHSKSPALPTDRSEIGPYQGSSLGYIPESFHQPGLTRTPPS